MSDQFHSCRLFLIFPDLRITFLTPIEKKSNNKNTICE